MVPSGERLEAVDLAAGQGDDRLELRDDLAGVRARCASARSSVTRRSTRWRISTSKNVIVSRPVTFDWYIAVSASRNSDGPSATSSGSLSATPIDVVA